MAKEAGIGARQRKAEDHQGLPQTTRREREARQDPPLRVSEGVWPCDTLISVVLSPPALLLQPRESNTSGVQGLGLEPQIGGIDKAGLPSPAPQFLIS